MICGAQVLWAFAVRLTQAQEFQLKAQAENDRAIQHLSLSA